MPGAPRPRELIHEGIQLAMGMIDNWRLDRHDLSKPTLLDHAETNATIL